MTSQWQATELSLLVAARGGFGYGQKNLTNDSKTVCKMSEDKPEIDGDQAFRRKQVLGDGYDPAFSGALSFMRRKYTRDLTGVDVAVTGIPLDTTVTNRSGARFGPEAVRKGSTQIALPPQFPCKFSLFDHLAVVDYGDCLLNLHRPETIARDITAHAREIISTGTSMLSIGGDHFMTYPLLKAHYEVHGAMSLIHFDAHQDTWEPDGDNDLNHGTMFTHAVREGLIDPARSIQIGIRTVSDYIGFTILDAPWVHTHGPQAVVKKIREVVGDKNKTYLTFDIDCLDPAFAPGTGTPAAGGLSSAQALEIIRSLGFVNFIGMDIVEVAPAYDHAEITAIAAATLAADYLALLAIKKRDSQT